MFSRAAIRSCCIQPVFLQLLCLVISPLGMLGEAMRSKVGHFFQWQSGPPCFSICFAFPLESILLPKAVSRKASPASDNWNVSASSSSTSKSGSLNYILSAHHPSSCQSCWHCLRQLAAGQLPGMGRLVATLVTLRSWSSLWKSFWSSVIAFAVALSWLSLILILVSLSCNTNWSSLLLWPSKKLSKCEQVYLYRDWV